MSAASILRWRLGLVVGLLALAAWLAPAAAHMVDIREHLLRPGTLSFGVALTGRPFAYREDGVLKGFEVALARAIAESAGLGLELVALPRDGLEEALRERRVDVVNTAPLGAEAPPRVTVVPYLNFGDHMMVLRGNPFRVRGADDLSGGVVSVTTGSTAEAFAHEINGRFLADGRAAMHIHSFAHQRFTPFPVVMGHAQAYFVTTRTAVVANQDPAGKASLIEGVFRSAGAVGFGVSPDNPHLADALLHGIARMVASDRYDRLREAHDLPLDLSPYR